MAKKNLIGSWAFLIGVILAVIAGLFTSSLSANLATALSAILIIIGLIVGLFNVTGKEVGPFLISGLALIIASAFGNAVIVRTLPALGGVLMALLTVFIPATIIVAIKNVFTLAKN